MVGVQHGGGLHLLSLRQTLDPGNSMCDSQGQHAGSLLCDDDPGDVPLEVVGIDIGKSTLIEQQLSWPLITEFRSASRRRSFCRQEDSVGLRALWRTRYVDS